jgi:aminoglycoside 3-N-acetyltransferase
LPDRILEDQNVTRAEIVSGLRRLGLSAGAGVMVHSSLKSFGHVEGGAAEVIYALMEVLTPQGTLLLPSFNHNAIVEEGGAGYFDPAQTPTTNGAIPEAFWHMPGVVRSLDPTHAIAAWGRESRRYVLYHHRTLTMGAQSPLGLLLADGGYGLLLGVGYGSNTFHHVVETMTGAPCLGRRSEAYPLALPDGRRVLARTWGWREQYCPLDDDTLYAETMRANGLHTETRIGGCTALLFRLSDCYTVVADLLQHGKDGFPPCSRCPIRPRTVAQTVSSDWDELLQRPVDTSAAWEY